jgi:hypothetical protein
VQKDYQSSLRSVLILGSCNPESFLMFAENKRIYLRKNAEKNHCYATEQVSPAGQYVKIVDLMCCIKGKSTINRALTTRVNQTA